MVEIEDPGNDRIIKQILPPPMFNLESNRLFPNQNLPDCKVLREHLTKEGKLSKIDIFTLINLFQNIVQKENNIVKVDDPVAIIGDIHGQYYDLIKILDSVGNISETKLVFLGDYVDRGAFSCECIFLLFALKINHKANIILLRGNHECRKLTTFFNFKHECEVKYDLEVYERIMEAFDYLPLSCLINNKFIAVHGGISPQLAKYVELNKLKRVQEPPKEGPLCDILWSDPCEKDDDALVTDWNQNKIRGCSFIFGAKAALPFLSKNKLLSVIRGHQVQLEGYKMNKWNNKVKFPSVITVFSAPNYCDVYNNKGAIIKIVKDAVIIQQFNFSPHPFILPNFMNVFSWSLPFVSEKVSEIILHIIKKDTKDNDNKANSLIDQTITDKLRMKVKFVTLLMKMFRTLREERELILSLKGFCPGNKIPKGILMQGPKALKTAIERYQQAVNYDIINERLPDI